MLDLQGTSLSAEEERLLQHPNTGGVILFSRNYQSPDQIRDLTTEIHAIRKSPLLIAVDHEGGRVQRFRDCFTRLPACRLFGEVYDTDRHKALNLAEMTGRLLARELLSVGVDFSFAPVLDLDTGRSSVIGDRAFHSDCEVVADLGRAFIRGMRSAGMAAVGKHFPGHGSIREDSHETVPVDNRRYEDIMMNDLIPFERLSRSGMAGIMPAHIIYSVIDDMPAGFSQIWLDEVLRKRLGFQGAVFSDDLSMAGAEVAGDYPQRAHVALAAGCDMVLVCNNQAAAAEVLESIESEISPVSQVRLMRMHGDFPVSTLTQLRQDPEWRKTVAAIRSIDTVPELDLDDDEITS